MGSAVILGAGLGIQAYSTYTGAKAAEATYKGQAKIGRQNAAIIGEQVKDVKALGLKAAKQIERETIEFAGDQVTQFASSGIDISSAVVGETLEQTARTGAADVIELLSNVKKDIWGLEVGKLSTLAQANLDKYNARQQSRAALIGLAGSSASIYGSTMKPANPLERAKPSGSRMRLNNPNISPPMYPRMR